VRVQRIGTTSITYEHAAYRIDEGDDDLLMVTATQTLVLIGLADRRPVPVPAEFRARVSEFEGDLGSGGV
jgi:acyl-CoA thioesterase FadM